MSGNALPVCGWCGAPCEIDTEANSGRFVVAAGQRQPRARYFDAHNDTDFCGARCSLEWTQAVRRGDPWCNAALDRN